MDKEIVKELQTTKPFSLMKLQSKELIVGNGNGEILVYKDDELIQTITQKGFQYEIQHSPINHMEMDKQEKFLVFSADASPTIYVYKKKE